MDECCAVFLAIRSLSEVEFEQLCPAAATSKIYIKANGPIKVRVFVREFLAMAKTFTQYFGHTIDDRTEAGFQKTPLIAHGHANDSVVFVSHDALELILAEVFTQFLSWNIAGNPAVFFLFVSERFEAVADEQVSDALNVSGSGRSYSEFAIVCLHVNLLCQYVCQGI